MYKPASRVVAKDCPERGHAGQCECFLPNKGEHVISLGLATLDKAAESGEGLARLVELREIACWPEKVCATGALLASTPDREVGKGKRMCSAGPCEGTQHPT